MPTDFGRHFYFLNFYVKPVLATGTNNRVLTFFLWQTKVVFAGRTLSVNVRFLVAKFTFLQIDKLLRFVGEFDKFLIFLLSFVNIS